MVSLLYQPPAMRHRLVTVLTNTPPRGPQSAPGGMQGIIVMETTFVKSRTQSWVRSGCDPSVSIVRRVRHRGGHREAKGVIQPAHFCRRHWTAARSNSNGKNGSLDRKKAVPRFVAWACLPELRIPAAQSDTTDYSLSGLTDESRFSLESATWARNPSVMFIALWRKCWACPGKSVTSPGEILQRTCLGRAYPAAARLPTP